MEIFSILLRSFGEKGTEKKYCLVHPVPVYLVRRDRGSGAGPGEHRRQH